ncbi:hypothetical protein HWV62_35260 [Athelia sp. TMB]|nr:hypothetical protein HWV62_35260 [Athelia sp. TMB]
MAHTTLLALALLAAHILPTQAVYNIARDYSGHQFFALFDYYGNIGDVYYLDQPDATSDHLAYVSSSGTAIVKVDNSSTVALGGKRNSIRLTSKDAYPVGSLFIIDALHLPFGCSVSRDFKFSSLMTADVPKGLARSMDDGRTMADIWSEMTQNEMVIHTRPGCTKTTPQTQTSKSIESTDCSTASGCVVQESAANSYGANFAQAGGGVWAMQFDVSGINIWFWRSTSESAIDISTWGNPSAQFPSATCNMQKYFGAQKIVVDITLCGVWAGANSTYRATCPSAGTTGICNINNVIGSGEQYDDAYFEFNYIRGYTMDGVSIFSTESQNYSSPSAITTVESVPYQTGISTPGTTPTSTSRKKSAALPRSAVSVLGLVAGLVLPALGTAWL